MKFALIGYGAMGQLVAALARDAGDDVGLTVTSQSNFQSATDLAEAVSGHDAAIDFSIGAAVSRSVAACALAGVPLVEGTTGWGEQKEATLRVMREHDGALVYGANFSIGVNVFYRIVDHAAALFSSIEGYAAFIEEAHHSRKRDAPSGTALRLHEIMKTKFDREIPIASTRAGYIPGTHRVAFDSLADQITLTHTARSREGFAAGALVAARWIAGRKGIYEFTEVIDEILGKEV